MIRSILVLVALAAGFRYAFKGPFYSLMFYIWLAYFRPEEWLWSDFLTPLRPSWIVGAWTLVYFLVSSERLQLGWRPVLLVALLAHSLTSTLVSPAVQYSWPYWVDFAKVIVVCLLLVSLVNSVWRLRVTLIVMTLSLGLEAARQGWVGLLLTPGTPQLATYPFLGDNNGVAVGMAMLTGLVVALTSTAGSKAERWLGRALTVGILYRGLATYSRGGFLAIGALLFHHLLRSKHKVRSTVGALVAITIILPGLPDAFWERMETIQTPISGEQVDESIASRIHFWYVAVDMAVDRPVLGVGHNAFNVTYDDYDWLYGQFGTSRSVHSAWFGVLAELGFVGFALVALLVGGSIATTARVRRLSKDDGRLKNLARLGTGIEAGLVAGIVGGAFVAFQYNEMLWHFVALSIVVGKLAAQHHGSVPARTEVVPPAPGRIKAPVAATFKKA